MRLDHGRRAAEIHDINVTPFIDVMLVLLIIFMVAAPLATVDIAVDLPSSSAEPQPRPDKPVYSTVKADLTPRASATSRSARENCRARSTPRPAATRTSDFPPRRRSVTYGDSWG